MVDWDLAVSIGSRIAGDGPGRHSRRGRRPWSPSSARAPTGPRGWSATSPGWWPPTAPRRSWSSTAPGWVQANADGFATALAPMVDKLTSGKRAPSGARPGGRLPGHRRRGRRAARLPRRQGARPVRPVLRAVRPAAAGRAQHRPRRARARRRPPRLPALGVPARGDPPGAVHRRARGSPTTCSARCTPIAETLEPSKLLDEGARPDRRGAQGRARRRQPARPGRQPGAEGDRRPGHRRDVAARGPRRRGDGRRRPDGDPDRRRHPQAFNQRRKGAGALDRLLRRAARPRRQDGAVPRRRQVRPRPSSTRSAWRSSTPSGSGPRTSRPRPRSPTRRPGSPASLAAVREPPPGRRRRPARACAARSRTSRPGRSVVVACSGGADSLALLAATVFEGRRAGWHVIGVTVDHGLQAGSAEQADRVVAQMAAARRRRDARPRPCTSRAPGSGPRRPPARRGTPCWRRSPSASSAAAVLLGHTRDDQAETVLLGLARGSGGRSLAGHAPGLRRVRAAAARRRPAPTP